MFGISKVMFIGWLTLILGILGIPQFLALVPESYLPLIAAIAGSLTILIRWLSGGFGANPLSVVGVVTLLAGLLGGPFWQGVIPATAMPVVTMIAAVCTLIARFYAGQSIADSAAVPVGFLMDRQPQR